MCMALLIFPTLAKYNLSTPLANLEVQYCLVTSSFPSILY